MFKEHLVFILMPMAFPPISSSVVYQHLGGTTDDEPIEDVDLVTLDVDLVAQDVNLVAPDVVMDIPLSRSEKAHRPII